MRANRTAISALFILFFVPLFAAGAGAAAAPGEVLYEGAFDVQDLEWTIDAEGRVRPALPDTRYLAEGGETDLPTSELLLLVPLDARVHDVVIEPLAVHTETAPGPLSIAAARFTETGDAVVADPAQATGPLTADEWGRFAGTHVWRGFRLLAVHVTPVRTATDGTVEFLDQYAVRVEMDRGADVSEVATRQRQVPGETQRAKQVLSRLVANAGAVVTYSRPEGVAVDPVEGFQPTASPSLLGSAVPYLIITNEEMAPEFQRLADFKTSVGLPTTVVTLEFIATYSRQGADLQDTIRMFAQDAYAMWGTEYLMLGGDTDIIPARYVDNSYYPLIGSTLVPVDLYFAGLDGNWNQNGNARYGEPYTTAMGDDQADFAEEVYLGRAPVSSQAAAALFVDKVIGYEAVSAGARWPNRALFAAEVLFPDDYPTNPVIDMDGAEFADILVNAFVEPCTDMEYARMYETDSPYTRDDRLTRSALIDSLNTGGFGIFNQIGHGFYFNMSVGDANFMTTDADALVNDGAPFLMYSLNCASAAFDYSCLMERFVQNPHGGSIVSIGASRAAFPTTSNSYQQNFFNYLFCTDENRAGRLLALSRLPYLASTYENKADRWTFENYTLLGDPTVPIWTSSPRTPIVSAPASISLGVGSFAVTVSDSLGPVAGALVCLAKEGEGYAVAQTDLTGQAVLEFQAESPGAATLTVSGSDLAVTQTGVPVVAGQAYLTVADLIVQDDGQDGSDGNGNGVIEAGETIALWPTLLETGGGSGRNVNGILTSAAPGVTIVDGTVSYGTVSAGAQVSPSSPFLVGYDAGMADGQDALFDLLLDGRSGFETETEFTTRTLAPEIEVTGVDWNDTAYGNGDGLAASGERLALSVRVKNYGGGTASDLTVRLRSDDSNVIVQADSVAAVSELQLMQEAELDQALSLTVVNAAQDGHSRLVIEDGHGRTTVHTFRISRPTAPQNLSVDTSLGADIIALRWDRTDADDRYGYDVYRSIDEVSGYERVNGDLVVNTSYYVDYGLQQFTKYWYRIVAVDTSLTPSAFSETVGQSTAPAQVQGFPLPFAAETSGPLAVGDVDGQPGLEVIVGSDEVYVWHHDGSELRDGDGDSQTLGPFTNLESEFQPAAIALANLDDLPGKEMVVCEKGTYLVHVYTQDGSEAEGWPQSTNGLAGTDWNWSAPAVGDIDGDGEHEIVVNTLNATTWAWNLDGSEVLDGDDNPATHGVFLQRAGGTWEWTMSGPALADLDGDGAKDIIFGTKNDDTGINRVMALRYDGTDVPGFPYQTTGDVGCHPAVGDLDGDGTLEVVVWDQSKRVYVIGEDGTDYPGFPYYTGIGASMGWVTSPALGDMDGDGMLEIIWYAVETGDRGRVAVIDTDYAGGTSGTMLAGWPKILPGSAEGSPIVADITGDGSPDILQGIGGGSEDAPNNLYAFHADGSEVAGFPITLNGPIINSVTVCDFDADSDVDIVYAGWDRQVHVWDMPFAYDPLAAHWPTFHGNSYRDGLYFPREMVGVGDTPPSRFQVGAPYPNPFNPVTKIRLYVPGEGNGAGSLDLAVFDLKGRRVKVLRSGSIEPGWHTVIWDGTDDRGRGQASGLYFLQARSGAATAIHKMTLLK